MEGNSKAVVRLFRFMRLFGINQFRIDSLNGDSIKAKVGWPDNESDDGQAVEWKINNNETIDKAIELGEFILDNKCISIDKITISESNLQNKINWNSNEFKTAINELLSIKVNMIDNGKKTDSFFLHF